MFNIASHMPDNSGTPTQHDSSSTSLTMTVAALYPHLALQSKGQKPHVSAPHLIPHPHWPPVQGRDCLAFWASPKACAHCLSLSSAVNDSNHAMLDSLIENSLSPATLSTYGSGLAHWHAWCNSGDIPKAEHLPVSANNLSLFIASVSH
jgi:hypothetical protein